MTNLQQLTDHLEHRKRAYETAAENIEEPITDPLEQRMYRQRVEARASELDKTLEWLALHAEAQPCR